MRGSRRAGEVGSPTGRKGFGRSTRLANFEKAGALCVGFRSEGIPENDARGQSRVTTGHRDTRPPELSDTIRERERSRPSDESDGAARVCLRAPITGDRATSHCLPLTAPCRQRKCSAQAAVSVRAAEPAPFPDPSRRKFTSSWFTSSAWVHVMQCGPSFTTNIRAPLIDLAVRSPEAPIGRIRSASP